MWKWIQNKQGKAAWLTTKWELGVFLRLKLAFFKADFSVSMKPSSFAGSFEIGGTFQVAGTFLSWLHSITSTGFTGKHYHPVDCYYLASKDIKATWQQHNCRPRQSCVSQAVPCGAGFLPLSTGRRVGTSPSRRRPYPSQSSSSLPYNRTV